MGKIKRGMSLYSFQHQYVTKNMNLEDMFKFMDEHKIGMEILGDQVIKNSPTPSEEVYKQWDELREKYPVVPVCNDIFINMNIFKNRTLTTKECTKMLEQELIMSHRLGFPMVRLVSLTPPEVVEPALPLAEKLNIVMALEVHAGMGFDNPKTMAFVDLIKRTQSPYLGLVLDTGIFCRRIPRVGANYFRHFGTSEEVIKYIDGIFESGTDTLHYFQKTGGVPEELKSLFKSDIDAEYTEISTTYENNDISILDEYMPYIKHIHGKIYEITEDGVEYSIPYKEIVDYLVKAGYEGYISTEYEGNRLTLPGHPIVEVEQVLGHQKMLKEYIGE